MIIVNIFINIDDTITGILKETPPSLLMPLVEPHTSLYVDIINVSINEINPELLI